MKKKIERQAKQLLVLLLVLAAGVGIFFALRAAPVEEPEAAAAEEYILGGIPQPFVKAVLVENASGSYTILNGFQTLVQQNNNPDSAGFSIEGMPEEELNQASLKSLIMTAGNLPSKQRIAEDAATVDLAQYGLAAPRASVQVSYEGGTETIEIGGESPGGDGVYVLHENAVHLVDLSKVAGYLGSRLDFVSRTVTPGNNQSTQIAEISLTGPAYPEDIQIEKAPEENDLYAAVGLASYRMLRPVQAGADGQTAIRALQSVYGLAANAVVDEDDRFLGDGAGRHGLLEPWLHITVETVPQEDGSIEPFEIVFSEPDENGLLYAQSSWRPRYIYAVHETALPFLALTTFDMQMKTIIQPNINRVSAVEVVEGDAIYRFELEGEGDALAVTFGDRTLNTDNFRTFYATLVSAAYTEELTEENAQYPDGPEAAEGESSVSEELQSGIDALDEYLEAPADETTPGEVSADAETEGDTVEEPAVDTYAPVGEVPISDEAVPEGYAPLPEGPQVGDMYAGQLLQIRYEYRDGSDPDVVTFRPGPPRKALVELNGGRAYYTRLSYVERVIQDVVRVSQELAVKPYI